MSGERRTRLPSPALVVSITALVVALTGSAFAAGVLIKKPRQLGKNVVTRRAIKNRAVSGAKIANGAITSRNLKLDSLGAVPLAATAGHATNADSAGHATNADSAGHATSADNSSTVAAQAVHKIVWIVPANTPSQTLFEAVGLKITASCDALSHISVQASGPAVTADLQIHGSSNGAFFDGSDSTFNSADADSLTSTTTSEGSAVLTYTTADRHIATMNYGFDFNTDAFGGGCAFWGEMLYS
jgi:hypothetical protein